MDRSQVHRTLGLLISPGERHEIRCLPGGKCKIVSGDDIDAATDAACSLDGTLYYSLNPISATADRANKNTVVRRAWLLLDVDPVKPPDASATEAEKAKAAEIVSALIDFLTSLGWPSPLVIDSGNGWHLLYRIDLPNDKLAHTTLKQCIYALAEKFDTEHAKIDRAVHDAARISKLPGTWSRKGLDTIDRPHRMAQVAFEPSSLDVVSGDLIRAVAVKPESKKTTQSPAVDPWTIRATDGGSNTLTNYVKTAIDKECIAISMAPSGSRNHQLNTSAFNLGTMADWPEMNPADAQATISRVALQAGLTDHETRLTVNSGWVAGAKSPRARPEPEKAAATSATANLAGRPPIKYASVVEPRKVEFLWPGRIPLGKLTTFAGQGGLGKTFVLCDMAVRIAIGGEWPLTVGGECATEGDVLFISGEDDEDDTLVPRIMECAGPTHAAAALRRIAFLSDEFADAFSLVNLDIMTQAIKAMNSPRLIVIDPPTNYLEKVNDHKNSELRSAVLRPLANFARTHRVAIILNNHVNKSTGEDVDAASRVMGSVAWVNGVRTAYMFVRDSSTPENVSIAPIKINIGKMPPTISYKIVDTGAGLAKVEWLVEAAQSADQVLKSTTAGARAAEWLTGMFREQNSWRSNDITRLAKEAGVTAYALFESKEVNALPFKKKRRTGANGEVFYEWVSNPGWPPENSESSESSDVNHCE